MEQDRLVELLEEHLDKTWFVVVVQLAPQASNVSLENQLVEDRPTMALPKPVVSTIEDHEVLFRSPRGSARHRTNTDSELGLTETTDQTTGNRDKTFDGLGGCDITYIIAGEPIILGCFFEEKDLW